MYVFDDWLHPGWSGQPDHPEEHDHDISEENRFHIAC